MPETVVKNDGSGKAPAAPSSARKKHPNTLTPPSGITSNTIGGTPQSILNNKNNNNNKATGKAGGNTTGKPSKLKALLLETASASKWQL
jgi:hypothetical protein